MTVESLLGWAGLAGGPGRAGGPRALAVLAVTALCAASLMLAGSELERSIWLNRMEQEAEVIERKLAYLGREERLQQHRIDAMKEKLWAEELARSEHSKVPASNRSKLPASNSSKLPASTLTRTLGTHPKFLPFDINDDTEMGY